MKRLTKKFEGTCYIGDADCPTSNIDYNPPELILANSEEIATALIEQGCKRHNDISYKIIFRFKKPKR